MLKSQGLNSIDLTSSSVVTTLDHSMGALPGLLPHRVLLVEERSVGVFLVGGKFLEVNVGDFFITYLDAGPALSPLDFLL